MTREEQCVEKVYSDSRDWHGHRCTRRAKYKQFEGDAVRFCKQHALKVTLHPKGLVLYSVDGLEFYTN